MASAAKWSLAAIVALALLAISAGGAAAAASWSSYSVPRPSSSPFEQPLGLPSDLTCWSASSCILLTAGDARSFSNGVFVFTGDKVGSSGGWNQHASVCGSSGSADAVSRVVWAGPNEYWVITTPSSPNDIALNIGVGLCHFQGGKVVGSYSTIRGPVDSTSDPYRRMNAGACLTPSNCWFGGVAAARPDGTSPGSFHLRWNGSSLKSVYAPAKRGVSDLAVFDGAFTESLFAGPDSSRIENPSLIDLPEYSPTQEIAADAVSAAGFSDGSLDSELPGFAPDAVEILALDSGIPSAPGEILWAVGGGAASGPQKDLEPIDDPEFVGDDYPADTGPFAAWREAGSADWNRVTLASSDWTINTRFIDVAAIPGTSQALAAVAVDNQFAGSNSLLALLDAETGTAQPLSIGAAGNIARVECVDANNCWAATSEGWLLRLSDPALPVALSTDPAFASLITARPNEVAEQALGDTAEDDSQLFAPPPEPEPVTPTVKRLKAAVQKVKTRLSGKRLVITFKAIRKVRVTITASRRGRVVAKTRSRLLKPGRHSLVLRLDPKRWPTKIAMKVKEPKTASTSLSCAPGGGCR